MKRVLIYGLVAVVLLVALVAALPFIVPLSAYKDQIEAAGSRATGRNVRIDGPLRLSFYPVFGVRAEKVTLGNVPGGHSPYLAQVDAASIAVQPAPLLGGRIEVSLIVLDRPQIHLEVDPSGKANWNFARSESASHGGYAKSLSLGDVRINDGTVTYSNAKTGSTASFDKVDVDLTLPESGQLTALGSFALRGTPVAFDVRVSDVAAAAGGGMATVKLRLTSDPFQADFEGTGSSGGDATGALSVKARSLGETMGLFGEPVSTPGGLGAFSLRSRLAAHKKVVTLGDAQLSLGRMTAKADLTVDTAGDVPSIAGKIEADRVDLNPFMGTPKETQDESAGWSRKPISLDVLKSANANLTLSTGSLLVRKLQLGPTSLVLQIKDRHLSATMSQIMLYGGGGSATLTADGSGPVPSFSNRLTFGNVAIAPFLGDTVGVRKIEGAGTLQLEVRASGGNADTIMHDLSGHGSIRIRNGQIHGVDLGMVARTIQTVIGGGATGEVAVTRFSTMGGTFAIAHGVLHNDDLDLAGPLINMTGAGDLDLGNRTIDFHVKPSAGIGGRGSALGVSVPVHITGSWNHLSYAPDLSGAVSGVLRNLENGGSSLTNLLGSGGSNTKDTSKDKKKPTVGDTVKGLFGIH